MAGNTVSVGLQVTAEGLDKVVDQSKQFKNNMQGGASALKAGEQASRGAMSAYRKENQEYGVSRAVGAGTGAASRDFAQQAQGLGGLVHLYATFAANIFAVSAAFTQLSKAADTRNMLEGMSQLSASGGRTLKTLANQMKDVSDGALSLKDSLNATALATAGGMTNSQILQMTNLARKASAALGRDMSDSMDRLTKGIIKVQPELLDELGIMTRVIPAQQAYALSVGKSIDSLTDFEKKQAFANAVLKEAEQKFGAIDVAANPYSKLSASLADLATNGLMALNTVIAPIAKFLSESPAALAGAVALLMGTLVKQAFPVLSNMKKLSQDALELKSTKANAISAETFAPLKKEHDRLFSQISQDTSKILNASIALDAELEKRYKNKALPKIWQGIVGENPENITKEQLAKLDKEAARLTTIATNRGTKNIAGEFITEYTTQIRAAQVGLEHLSKSEKALDDIYLTRQGVWTAAGNQQANADKLNQAVRRDSIKLAATEVASMNGVVAGWKKMNAEIKEARSGGKVIESVGKDGEAIKVGIPAMSAYGAGLTRLKTGASLAVQGVMNLSNAIGMAGMVASAGVAVFELMDWAFSTNAKSLAAFTTSLESFTEASKVANDTVASIAKKPLDQVFSISSIIAAATALNGVSQAMSKVIEDYTKLKEQSSWWDDFTNFMKGLAGYSAEDKLIKQFNTGLISSLKTITDPKLKQVAEQNIRSIMSMGDNAIITEQSLSAVEAKMTKDEVIQKQKALALVIEEVNRQASKSNLQQYSGTMETFVKSYDMFLNTMKSSDPMQVLARDMYNVANALELVAGSMGDVASATLALADITNNPEKLRLVPVDMQKELLANKEALEGVTKAVANLTKERGLAEERLKNASAGVSKMYVPGGIDSESGKASLENYAKTYGNTSQGKVVVEFLQAQEALQKLNEKQKATEDSRSATAIATEQSAQRAAEAAKAFAEQIAAVEVNMASVKAQVTAIKGIAQGLSSARSLQLDAYTTKLSNSAEREQLEVQKRLVEQSTNALDASQEQTLAIKANTAALNLKSSPNASSIDAAVLANKNLKIFQYSKEFATAKTKEEKESISTKAYGEGLSNDDINKAIKNAETTAFTRQASLSKITASLIQLNASDSVANVNSEVGKYLEQADNITKNLDIALKNASNTVGLLRDASGTGSDSVLELIKTANNIAKSSREAEAAAKADAFEETIKADLTRINALTNEVAKKQMRAELSDKLRNYNANMLNQQLDARQKSVQETYNLDKAILDIALNKLKIEKQLKDIADETAQTRIDYAKKLLDQNKSLGSYTEAYAIKQQAELDLSSELLANKKKLADIELSRKEALDTKNLEFSRQKALVSAQYNPDTMDANDKLALAANLAAIDEKQLETNTQLNSIYDAQVQQQQAKLDLAQKYLNASTSVSIEHAKQKELLDGMVTATSSLAAVFGDVGNALGTVVQKLAETANAIASNRDAELKAQEQINELRSKQVSAYSAGDMEALRAYRAQSIKAEDDLAKVKSKNDIKEMQSAAQVAGAVKGMFDKKSAAAKAFGAVEKTLHLASLAMQAVQLASNIAAAAKTISTWMPAAVVRAFGELGWWAAPMAIAGLAAIAGSSGDSSVNVTGITAADRQSTQGTGMSWALDSNGEMTKQENGGGVFGDTSMKSDSINKSLEIIKATSVEGISYDTKMVDLLNQINLGINKLATTLYTVQGVRTGTGFGTVEGTSGGGGGLLSGLFGSSKTETSIIDSGIKLKGTFMDLVNAGKNANAVLQQFETVQTTTTSSGAFFGLFGGGSSSSVRDNIKELDSAVREQIGGVFSNARDIFVEQGKKLSMDVKSVDSILSSVNVDKLASLRGLKGDELDKELNSVISSIMDDAAKELFPKLDQFKRFNEGYAQTVTRVLDTNSKINDSFKAMGKTMVVLAEVPSKATEAMLDAVKQAEAELAAAKAKVAEFKPTYSENPIGYGAPVASTIDPKLTDAVTESEKQLAEARETVKKANEGMTANNLALTESLADAAGGLDKFLELTKTFTDKYLSEVERAGPKVDALRTEMASLGLSSTTTRTQLKTLISTYEVTDAKTAQYYVDLLKLADAYDAAGSEIDKIAGKLGMSTSGIQSILSDAVKNANSEEEARKLGTQGFADALNSALQSSLISGISSIIYSSVIEPMIASLTTGATAASLDIATGGAVAGSNMATGSAVAASDMATGSAVAGSNMAAGSAVAGSNMAAGSAAAGSNMASGGAAAAQNLTSGSQVAAANIAGAIGKVKEFVTTFVGVMKDPEVQSALKELSSSFGDFAAMAYTGSSAINTLTTSIGGTSKAATGSSGSGGASSAADDLTKAWQSAADAIFEEVKRIKGIMLGTGAAALENAKSKFESATLAARAGDIEQAKLLPQLSQTLLTLAESNASSALDLRKIQAATAASLETTGLGAVSQYGLKLPSYDIGTNYVPKDMIAQIHEGEQIVPKAYNPSLNNQSNDALVQEIKILQQQVASLVAYNRTISDNTQKTRDVLVRVTEDGRAIQTEVAA